MEKQKFGKLLKRLLIVCLCFVMALGSAVTIIAASFDGDLNNDGQVTALDAQLLAEYEADLRDLDLTDKIGLTVKSIIDWILGRTESEPSLDEGVEVAFEVEAENGVVTEDKTVTADGVTATVAAGTKVTGKTLKLSVKKTNSTEGEVALGENQEQLALDIYVDGVAADNTTPVVITVEQALDNGYNQGNLELYHVENSVANEMEQVDTTAALNEHNSFCYDPATGDFTVAMATFSVVRILTDNTKVWNGTVVDTWYRESETSFEIFNADQLAGLGKLVDEGKTFEGKTVTLCMDVTLSNGSHEDTCKSFNPIGYGYNYDKTNGRAFKGTFDGNGNTIYNLYQNGWELQYSNSTAGGGLFASVYGATIKNLTMDNAYIVMECVDMGTVVGYAQGDCAFENIVVRNSTLANYQRYTGGVIGEVSNGHHTLTNVDVEASTTVGSLWGDFDNASGGLIGGKWGHNYDNETGEDNQKVSVYMEDCDVAATLDVYNDVTSAYQWYSYRRCGMLIGMSEESKSVNGRTEATAPYLTTKNCTVTYTGWEDYHYCEFNGTTSMGARFPWVRVEAGNFCDAYSNVRYGVPTFDDAELDVVNHTNNGDCHVPGDGHNELIVFNQLYGGGQGCYGGNSHAEGENPGVTVYNEDGKMETATKFVSTGVKLIQNGDTVKLSELFQAAADVDIQSAYVYAFVSPANEDSTVRVTKAEPKADTEWEDLTITFSGEGAAKIVITDYNYCKETELYVTVGDLGWVLVTDASELTAGDKVVIAAAEYDYALSTTQNGNNRGQAEVTKANDTITFANDVQILTLEAGTVEGTLAFNAGNGYLYAASSSSNHLRTQTENNTNGSWAITVNNGIAAVVAQGDHSHNEMRYNESSKLFSCYEAGNSQKDIVIYKLSIVCAHTNATITVTKAPTCTEKGIQTVNCTVCGFVGEEEIPALGHDEQVKTVDATCGVAGSKTTTCSRCDLNEVEEIPATGEHSYADGKCSVCGAAESKQFIKTDLTNIKATDTVVITMTKDGTVYAMSNDNGTNSAPSAVTVKVEGDKITADVADNLKWNIVKGDDGFVIYPAGTTSTWLYCTETNNGVRVGTNAENKAFQIEETYEYLFNSKTERYIGVYNKSDWRCYEPAPTGTSNIAGQTLAFYVIPGAVCDEHTWDPATCTEPKTCSKCEATEGEALGHTESYVNNENGTHNVACEVCQDILEENVTCEYANGKCVCGAEESTGGVTPSEPVTLKYSFSEFSGSSTQYAVGEEHALGEGVKLTLTHCHINTQLRMYSSNDYDANAIIEATGVIASLTVKAGYKADTLNVYGYNATTETWELFTTVDVTTSYTEKTIDLSSKLYTQLMLDVKGTQQVRISELSLTWVPEN